MVDYNAESHRLDAFVPGETSMFWKPKPGQYRVKGLSELGDSKPFEEEGKDPKPQMEISIIVEDKQYIWTMSKGKTSASTYGQLIKLGASKGRLANVDFMVVVTSDGKKNSYTIVTL